MAQRKKEPQGNYFKVPHQLLETTAFQELSNREFRLFIYLCKLRNRFGQKDGSFYTGERTLAAMCGMSRDTLRKAREGLMKACVIDYTKKPEHGKRTHYKLLV